MALVVNDLIEDRELDAQALRTIAGGSTMSAGNWSAGKSQLLAGNMKLAESQLVPGLLKINDLRRLDALDR